MRIGFTGSPTDAAVNVTTTPARIRDRQPVKAGV
jgi:hypothetical protein